VVARRSMGAPAALLTIGLLGTNLWFLHFSRTAWENSNSALFALGACWCAQKAIDEDDWTWWARAGVFVAFGFYGYFSGRFIFVSVALIAALAIALRLGPFRNILLGLCLAGVISAILFAPQARRIYNEWDYFNQRTENVSVFNGDPYEGTEGGWQIAWENVGRNVRGLVLMDPAEMGRGLWVRYTPEGRPPLDDVSKYLFWAGLVIAAVRWRRTYTWWPFFVPLFIVEVFSRGTPDLARAMIFAPFYFLFIGMVFDEALHTLRRYHLVWQAAALAAFAALAIGVARDNVTDYFDWQENIDVQRARLPGVDRCEFDVWNEHAYAANREGHIYDPALDETVLKQLGCSPVRE
jgi:hypothetical protein